MKVGELASGNVGKVQKKNKRKKVKRKGRYEIRDV